jgi:hypothetical protein
MGKASTVVVAEECHSLPVQGSAKNLVAALAMGGFCLFGAAARLMAAVEDLLLVLAILRKGVAVTWSCRQEKGLWKELQGPYRSTHQLRRWAEAER